MHPSIEQLLKLQKVDSEIRFLDEARRARPRELADDRRKVDAAEQSLSQLEAEIKQERLEIDRGELELKRVDEEITKANVTLNTVKTNQEYSVVKEQVHRKEEEKGQLEEDVLNKLSALDGLQTRRRELQDRLEAAKKNYRRREAEVNEILEALDGQRSELDQRRAELARGVPQEHLEIYERVLAYRKDLAVAPVKDSICHGCYMAVTPQNVSVLVTGRELIQCKHCSRLLYVE